MSDTPKADILVEEFRHPTWRGNARTELFLARLATAEDPESEAEEIMRCIVEDVRKLCAVFGPAAKMWLGEGVDAAERHANAGATE